MAALTAKMRGRSIFSRLTVPEKKPEHRLLRNLELVEARLEDCAGRAADPRVTQIVGHEGAADPGAPTLAGPLAPVLIRVDRGNPTGEELAAISAVLVHAPALHAVPRTPRPTRAAPRWVGPAPGSCSPCSWLSLR
ncbi:acyl-CoA carboxylase subunit epsilon [Streptomyces sp. NPDC006692]|uniref:acyl-CoA carboxylase subunit epsilon n=1 Tax=Streptomyces sp. NPDC006692 TaxID=3364758 RepID=UPI003681F9B0